MPEDKRRVILRSAAASVAPGGLLLLVGHDADNLEHGHGGPQDPEVLYSADDIAGDLQVTGLWVERAHRVERPVETAEGPKVALDALVRARRDAESAK